MMDIDRCADCPAAGRCVVEWTGHRAYCDWAAAGGERRARVVAMSAEPPDRPGSSPPAPPWPEGYDASWLPGPCGGCP
jgi:hypothetical protein